MMFTQDMTIAQAKSILREKLHEGVSCPTCSQTAKMYRRKVHSSMAHGLLVLYREKGRQWARLVDTLPGVASSQSDFSKLRYWNLVEAHPNRPGWWRVTELGESFALGRHSIQKYAYLYNNKVQSFDGEQVTVRHALGDKFDYDELMAVDASHVGDLVLA